MRGASTGRMPLDDLNVVENVHVLAMRYLDTTVVVSPLTGQREINLISGSTDRNMPPEE